MSGLYLTDMADVLRAAGLNVIEYQGWQTRARSSGGYAAGRPYCIMWHHTASSPSASAQQDADYMTVSSSNSNRPTANLMIARNGDIWVLCAGASNTNGKGKSIDFTRGTVPQDSMNTYAIGIEMQNNGVGEPWSEAMINTAFAANNALTNAYGMLPVDLATHQFYAPDRKIDPATASAVQGPWQPASCTSSGTWEITTIQSEAQRRATGDQPIPPGPTPPTPPDVTWYDQLMGQMPMLSKGVDNYWFVKRMQHLIAAAGFMDESNTANYDGAFGSGTEGALNRFKQAAGGQPDGICDPWTWGALMHTIDGIPTIQQGDQGADVKRMQHLLAANGYMNEANTSNYDGQWGSGTEKAKVNYDNAAGLTPSPPSDCGQKSWTALLTV